MRELVDRHVEAEIAGDLDGAVSMYADDIEHDVVGSPTGPIVGPEAVKVFYAGLQENLSSQEMEVTREYYGEDFCVIEHDCTGVVDGEFMGMPGNGRRVSFRMLHLWEFEDDAMTRENIWLDGGTIAAQLMGPAA